MTYRTNSPPPLEPKPPWRFTWRPSQKQYWFASLVAIILSPPVIERLPIQPSPGWAITFGLAGITSFIIMIGWGISVFDPPRH